MVGYATGKIEICLSNLMAFDAVAQGNWGADPLVYPELMQWIVEGTVVAAEFRGVRKLGEAASPHWAAGVVLYDGETTSSFGNGLFAVPIRALWES